MVETLKNRGAGYANQSFIVFRIVVVLLDLSAGPGAADGAVAIGVPRSVVKNGVAEGYSVRAKNPDEAREVAMGYCGDVKKSSKEAVAL
jgi:hypothetical protein